MWFAALHCSCFSWAGPRQDSNQVVSLHACVIAIHGLLWLLQSVSRLVHCAIDTCLVQGLMDLKVAHPGMHAAGYSVAGHADTG